MLATPEYCRLMARYNAWQNDGLREIIPRLSSGELVKDRGAFFGSLLGTLNHLLWGDRIWMSRFAGLPAPEGGIKDSPQLCPTAADWAAERYALDRAIIEWARELRNLDLEGSLTWYSGAAGREVSAPLGRLIVHFFNHQTHHRGQAHAMLTAMGERPGDTDLFLMPGLD